MLKQIALVVYFVVIVGTGICGEILFDSPTDTIAVLSNTIFTSSCTYEVWIKFDQNYNWPGTIFTEWKVGGEDKVLYIDPQAFRIAGYAYPSNRTWYFAYIDTSIIDDSWHHVAFVKDAFDEYMYIDGKQIGHRVVQNYSIKNHDDSIFRLGAIYKDSRIYQGFTGYLDSLRISNIPRYTGLSYKVPERDMKLDAHTVLLLWFKEPPGSDYIKDEVSGEYIGLLGAPFDFFVSPKATKPQLLNPSSQPYCTSILTGDLNNDCRVNILDFNILIAQWLSCNLEPVEACWD